MIDTSTLPGPDDVGQIVLPNGMRALYRENLSSPAVVIDGLVYGGAISDPAGKEGLASFCADMLERGTRDRTFAELSDLLESIGADVSFGAGRHTVGFSAKCLQEDLPTVLGLLSDMFAKPAFEPVQVDRVRGQLLTGLRQKNDNTRHRASERFRELAYGDDHPYGRSTDGSLESVGAITRDDIARFHAEHIHPAEGIITVVGAFGSADLEALLQETLGAWQPGQPAAERPPVPAVDSRPAVRDEIGMPGKVQSDVVMGHAAIPRTHPDWIATSLANAVLGVFGMMGRLGENVRDRRGLAYYAYSRVVGGLGPGPWYAAAGVNPAGVDEAVGAIVDEMNRIRSEAVPEAELDDVKAYVTGSLPLQLETNEGIAQALVDIALYDLGLDYLRRYPERINAIDTDAIAAAAVAHLHPDRLAIAIAGPGT